MTVLVLGGASSGKSEIAEGLCMALGERRGYLATMEPWGEEARARVKKHRKARREKGFDTLECYRHLEELQLPGHWEAALLECVGNLLANEAFPKREGSVVKRVLDGIESLEGQIAHWVVVTNQVFSSAEQYDEETAAYLEWLGEVNIALARRADVVVEAVAGLPLVLKGHLPTATGGDMQ